MGASVDPWNRARYLVLAEYTPLSVHRQRMFSGFGPCEIVRDGAQDPPKVYMLDHGCRPKSTLCLESRRAAGWHRRLDTGFSNDEA